MNRHDAGRQLARLLGRYGGHETVMLAPMNGSVVLARELGRVTGIPLDVMMVCTLHHPIHWHKCIGAVSAEGGFLAAGFSGFDQYTMAMMPRLRRRLSEQAALFKRGKVGLSLKGRTVIVVCEGCRTGLKLAASLRLVAKLLPARIIVAAPVMSAEAQRVIKAEGYEVHSLYNPMPYVETRGFYKDFRLHSDEELADLFIDR